MTDIRTIRLKYHPKCTYCDEPATTKDHVPPRCVQPGSTKTVPACRRCNTGILGGIRLLTVEERQEYVTQVLTDRGYRWKLATFA